MRQQHDALTAAFAEIPPAWGPLATELVAVGLTDADGKPPTAKSARQTWYRVRRNVARARERRWPPWHPMRSPLPRCRLPSPLPPTARPPGRLLTAAEFHRLSDVPPEVEWFANLTNPQNPPRL